LESHRKQMGEIIRMKGGKINKRQVQAFYLLFNIIQIFIKI